MDFVGSLGVSSRCIPFSPPPLRVINKSKIVCRSLKYLRFEGRLEDKILESIQSHIAF